MKKIVQKILSTFSVFLMGLGLIAPAFTAAPAYATSGPAIFAEEEKHTVILTGCEQAEKDEGNGAGIKCVVLVVVNILSVLVGIVGVIGIVIVGIQYLTAGGNEEQTRKAKRRLFEIVIGLIAFVLMSALLNWLLPGFNATNNSTSLLMTSTGA